MHAQTDHHGAPDLASRLGFLGSLAAHRGYLACGPRDGGVETVETHMSWLFLVAGHVLKLKKPVRYPFLDFSTLAARLFYCREELRLNRRLAPATYLGLMALQWDGRRLALVPEAQARPTRRTLEWLVLMRRLPADRMLDRLIEAGELRPGEVDALAEVLVGFYRRVPAVEVDAAEHAERLLCELAAHREVLLRPQFRLRRAADALDRLGGLIVRSQALLAARVQGRRLVDGHGDLRPEHVCLQTPPVVIDALEFNPVLRQVDPVDELAFLGLECEMLGAPWVGRQLLARYAAATGDRPPASLVPLYTAHRALLRARLAMAHLLDPQPRTPQRWAPLAQRYVDRSLRAISAATRRGSA
jgi:aminoglycoside phosphotransferase family enzyme